MKIGESLILALSASLLAVSLTACGDAKTDGDATKENETSANTSDTAAVDTVTETEKTEEVIVVEDTSYVIADGITPKMIELSRLNEGNKVRLAEKMKKAAAGEEITIAYIGGSITQGSSAGTESCYAKLTYDWFCSEYPNAKVNYVNAGIGATGSYIGVHRVDEDVLSKNPDIVFVEFSVNDTTENTQRNIDSYDSLLRKIWNSSQNPAIITIAMTQEDGTSFQEYHSEISKAYDIPMISYKNAILHVIDKGYIKWTDISDDNIHPNVTGHSVLTEIIVAYLDEVSKSADEISGSESNFVNSYTSDKYKNAGFIVPRADAVLTNGMFEIMESGFGNFNGYWKTTVEAETAIQGISFEVEAQNIGILFGKLVRAGGSFEVKVDGETVKTVSSDFTGGWGNYVEADEVYSSDKTEKHTVEIIPLAATDGSKVNLAISRIAIS